jgi:hypothetical protein
MAHTLAMWWREIRGKQTYPTPRVAERIAVMQDALEWAQALKHNEPAHNGAVLHEVAELLDLN